MFVSDRESSRNIFIQVWQKQLNSELMEPLEHLISHVISVHPEYHYIFDEKEIISKDFNKDTGIENPFLHMGLHIAVSEQLGTDRPQGIAEHYQRLVNKYKDEHQVQHQLMECLQKSLWHAQIDGGIPDEADYLDCVSSLK
jgi:hypothetical protein